MNLKRIFGWLPDLPDKGDIAYLYRLLRPIRRKLPKIVDLRGHCSKVEDQGQIGSCVGNASVANMEFLEIKNGVPYKELSRLFVYYNARVEAGLEKQDSGCYIRDAIKTLAKYGVCPEENWSYDVKKVNVKPLSRCYDIAEQYQIISYHRILTLNEMRTCLFDGYPIVFGFSVYESIDSEKVSKTGIIPYPKSSEKLCGGHAILAVGYDDRKETILIRNSWGEGWGDKGYGRLPYKYITTELADDFWTIRQGEQI